MKKILIIVLCFFTVFLSGCQSEPQFTISVDSKGQVTQNVYIPFSVSELVQAGVDGAEATSIGTDIKTLFDNYFLNMYDNFETRLNIDTGLTEEQKSILLSSCPTREQVKGKGQMFENSDIAGITYELNYKSVIAYYYFNFGKLYEDLLVELEKDESRLEHNFLTTDKINSTESIYGQNAGYAQTMTLAEYINKVCVDTLAQSTNLTVEQIDEIVPKDFIYRYGTTSKRMHSDADVIRNINGIYYHEWIIDLEQSDRIISTWYTYANQNVWYAIALGLTIIFVIVLILFNYFNERKKRSTQLRIINEK